jgi:uncharacterized membrane protein
LIALDRPGMGLSDYQPRRTFVDWPDDVNQVAAALGLDRFAVLGILVAALLKNQLWAYPWTIAFLGVFILYQVYRLSLKASVGLAALTIFDAVIAWLTYREYRKQLAVAHR